MPRRIDIRRKTNLLKKKCFRDKKINHLKYVYIFIVEEKIFSCLEYFLKSLLILKWKNKQYIMI